MVSHSNYLEKKTEQPPACKYQPVAFAGCRCFGRLVLMVASCDHSHGKFVCVLKYAAHERHDKGFEPIEGIFSEFHTAGFLGFRNITCFLKDDRYEAYNQSHHGCHAFFRYEGNRGQEPLY